MKAAEIAATLCRRPVRVTGGGWLTCCPVPGHGKGRGDRNPSLLVKDGDVPGRVLITCFGGCDRRDILAELRARNLLEDLSGGYAPGQRTPVAAIPSEPQHEPDPEALRLWEAAQPIEGTLAARYLAEHRGIAGPHPPALRYAPSLIYPGIGPSYRFPALVAAVSSPAGEVIAVQATYLRPNDGRKAPLADPRRTTGALGLGAVRLGEPADVLGLAEGVEDALAAQMLAGVPCWAALGAARMHRVAVRPKVRELHIFADDDEPGRAAAERTAAAQVAAGRKVLVRLPPAGVKDWGALALRQREAAA